MSDFGNDLKMHPFPEKKPQTINIRLTTRVKKTYMLDTDCIKAKVHIDPEVIIIL